jgi:hypothetical protein
MSTMLSPRTMRRQPPSADVHAALFFASEIGVEFHVVVVPEQLELLHGTDE